MKLVGFTAGPADAISFVKEKVDYVCEAKGGDGCFREFAELLIDPQNSRRRANTITDSDMIALTQMIGKTYKLSTVSALARASLVILLPRSALIIMVRLELPRN